MAKVKKKTAPAKRVTARKVAKHKTRTRHLIDNPAGTGVYWYGIHIHHVGLGVAAAGTLVLVLALVVGII